MAFCPSCGKSVLADSVQCPSCSASFDLPGFEIFDSRLTPDQERALRVPTFALVILGLLGIGGGAVGLVAISSAIASTGVGAMDGVIMTFAGLLYVFGGYCGVAALRKAPGWLHFNQLFWVIQVPVISSPFVSYFFSTGGFFNVWLQVYPPIRGGFNFLVGSSFTINFLASSPVAFGVNIFAAAIAIYLARLGKSRAA